MGDEVWKHYVAQLENLDLPAYSKAEIILSHAGLIPAAEFPECYLSPELSGVLDGLGLNHERYHERVIHSRDSNIIHLYIDALNTHDDRTLGKLNGYPDCCVDDYVRNGRRSALSAKLRKAVDTDRKVHNFTIAYVPCEQCLFSDDSPSTELETSTNSILREKSPKIHAQVRKNAYSSVYDEQGRLHGIITPEGKPISRDKLSSIHWE